MAMKTISVIGGRGYAGESLLRLVLGHPDFELGQVCSRSLAGRSLGEIYPDIDCELRFASPDPADLLSCDAMVLALPNGHAKRYVEATDEQTIIIDLSADYRFDANWTYGLPETQGDLSWGARIANPGCYATAAQLALAPLASELAAVPSVFGVSGYSGAGRRPGERNDPERLQDNLLPYALNGHVHEREVSLHLGTPVVFMPHVARLSFADYRLL